MIKMVKSLFPSKSERKRRAVWRKFKNVSYIMSENGIDVHERHNLFVECMNEAKARVITPENKSKEDQNKHMNLNAQYLFVEKALVKYRSMFEGKMI